MGQTQALHPGALGVTLWRADPVFQYAVIRYQEGPMTYRRLALFTSKAEAEEAIRAQGYAEHATIYLRSATQ